MEQCSARNNKPSKYRRLAWVDIAKGIGIISVMMSHAGIGNYWITTYYIPMFATLSGVSFYYNKEKTKKCFIRIKSIIWIYIKNSLFILGLWIPLSYLENGRCLILGEIFGILYGRKSYLYPYNKFPEIILMNMGNGPLWYLCFLAVSWVGFYWLIRNCNYSAGQSSCSAKKILFKVFLLCILSVVFSEFPFLMPWSIDTAPIGAIFILFGYCFEMFKEKNLDNEKRDSFSCIIWIMILIILMIGYDNIFKSLKPMWNLSVRDYTSTLFNSPIIYILFCAYGTLMIFAVCILVERYRLVVKLFEICGRKSLVLLCYHAIVYRYISISEKILGMDVNPYFKVLFAMIIIFLVEGLVKIIKKKLD